MFLSNLIAKLFVKDYQNTTDVKVRKSYGLVASFFGLITNFILFLGKIIVGFVLGLFSLISDSINNLSDFGSNIISIFGVKISAKPADKEHPYGHQRLEYIITLVIGCIVIAFGILMIYQGIISLIDFIKSMINSGKPEERIISKTLFIATTIILSIAILIKIVQAYLYRSFGKKISSMQLVALSKDSLNDVIDTIFVLVGVIISYFTKYDIDCFFTLFVSAIVIKSGVSILKGAINELIGKKADEDLVKSISDILESDKRVLGIHDLELHSYGKKWYGSISVEIDGKTNIMEAHAFIDQLERDTKEKLDVQLSIHMDPIYIDDPQTSKYKNVVLNYLSTIIPQSSIHDFKIENKNDKIILMFDLVLPTECSLQQDEQIESKVKDYIYSTIHENVDVVIDTEIEGIDLLSKKDAK